MTEQESLATTLTSFAALPIPARPLVDKIVKQARADGRVFELATPSDTQPVLRMTELELLTCVVYVFAEEEGRTGVLVIHRCASDLDGEAYAAHMPSGGGRGTRLCTELRLNDGEWVFVAVAPLAATAIRVLSGLFCRKYACAMSVDARGEMYFAAPCEVCGVIVHRQTDADLAACAIAKLNHDM